MHMFKIHQGNIKLINVTLDICIVCPHHAIIPFCITYKFYRLHKYLPRHSPLKRTVMNIDIFLY